MLKDNDISISMALSLSLSGSKFIILIKNPRTLKGEFLIIYFPLGDGD